jgi:[ribosomal protein S18]-alanine N-acetyltransferase
MMRALDQYRLQPARLADAPLLAAMSQQLVETGLAPSWDTARIRWHVQHPDSMVLTARAPQTLAGFAIMRYLDDRAHLNLLAVAPAHRRRGVARSLLEWLEESARTAGTFVISLELRASNLAALGFYRALGYAERGAVPGYYQGVESAIRMQRDLRAATARS